MKLSAMPVIIMGMLVTNIAHAQNIQPGQYDYAVTTEMMGMKIPINFKQCVTQKDVDSNQAYVNQKGSDGCTPPVVKRDGSSIAIKYTCSNPKMTGEEKVLSVPIHSPSMNVIQHDMGNSLIKTQVTGKRVGAC
ncbi:MAG: DUF3617 family protein [Rhodoferax sp.]|nr:DUF3617 family protein [Rhodoferax sp.]